MNTLKTFLKGKTYKRKNIKVILFFCVTVLILFLFLFAYLWKFVSTDIQLHAAFVRNYLFEGGRIPSNFLYYVLLIFFSFGNYAYIGYVSVALLAILTVGKFIISEFLFRNFDSNNYKKANHIQQTKWDTAIVFLNLFVFAICIPELNNNRFYLGLFPSNVWHNSTIIAVFPFAILLFYFAYKLVTKNQASVYIYILILLNAALKPSYLFVLILALPFFYVLTKGFKDLQNLIKVVVFIFAVILLQYLVTYIFYPTSDSKITISPFSTLAVWNSTNLSGAVLDYLISLLLSYLFPLSLLLFKNKRKNPLYIFALINVVFSHLIFILLAETGYRAGHGNFVWQIYICTYILFLVSSFLIKDDLVTFFQCKKITFPSLFFILHVLSGVFYIVFRLFFEKTYL